MNLWNFRPSVFSLEANYADVPVETIVEQYVKDNERACKEGVQIHPRSRNAILRSLQWNINDWMASLPIAATESSTEIARGIIETILNADADVIVLNEYNWGSCYDEHKTLQHILQERGYSFYCATVSCPTAIATRWHVDEIREIRLSVERSALALKVKHNSSQNTVWVIGTHLDYECGRQRQKEIQTLLEDLNNNDRLKEMDRIILMGDLNQQRKQDYSEEEWKKICDSMDYRQACHDDGVASLLQGGNFCCAWDEKLLPPSKCNWETSQPPSTHWSGTIVDYSYGRYVQVEGVSVSPVGWSDHRMTVCDWKW